MEKKQSISRENKKIALVVGFISFIISLIVIFSLRDILIARILFVLGPFLVLFGDER